MKSSTFGPGALTLLALSLLSGCASFIKHEAEPEAAFVVLGEQGKAIARAITTAPACPSLSVDGHARAMNVRSPLQAIPPRPGARLHQPASTAVMSCEAAIPAGARQVLIAGRALPLPKAEPQKIVVIGDTGCRIKNHEVQDCNDEKAFPFAHIAAAAAAFGPDLVIHVGDFHYREEPCPADRPGCKGSPWGYGWDAWNADFFQPAKPLLHAAPWLVARGNHESCDRAGQGWWRYLDPHAIKPNGMCDDPNDDLVGDYSDPYAVPIGPGAQIIVFDTANTSYKGFKAGDPRRAIYADTLRKVQALSRQAGYNIALDHHPLFAFGATEDKKTKAISLFGGDKGLLEAFGDVEPDFLPSGISVLLSGHVHLWEQTSFGGRFPTQFVAGFSGTDEDILPLPAAVPPSETPAPGAVVQHMSSWIDGFGFMTMERTGPQDWLVTVRDRDGRERNTCRVHGKESSCEIAQVK
ncbi:metallophosphoesterase [Massilia terrae]|uniref:Metallophosphoesterase n=1 Tax=Massilia terrae TaxID=1811224 RepID=A0ABT2CU61_9BURK|nr:metallophosphoesterase [Massilia terrae]MCS0657510.1 metallophosphoesterase [Massilia terrae]